MNKRNWWVLMNKDNFIPDDSIWSIEELETAEYNYGRPISFDGSYNISTTMSDYQPAMSNNRPSIREWPEEIYSSDMMTREELSYKEWKELMKTIDRP